MMNKKLHGVNPRRLTLRGWATMDNLKRQIDDAAAEGLWAPISELIFQVIDLAVDNFDRKSFWVDTVAVYGRIATANKPSKPFPILTSKAKAKPLPWEYDGRSWYFWLNLFARNYGWDEEKIASMDIDDAIGLYQEIVIEDQIEDEWEYGLSEIAYPYNPSTKKSSFKPLPRPDWMIGISGKPNRRAPKVRIPTVMMPVGNIVNLDEG